MLASGFSVLRVRLVQRERFEVRAIEHVEHLEDAIDLDLRSERKPLLEAHVDAMQRRLVEAVALDERPVLAQAAPVLPCARASKPDVGVDQPLSPAMYRPLTCKPMALPRCR